jgi:hypothetical protein
MEIQIKEDLSLEQELNFINKLKKFISEELNSDYNVNLKAKDLNTTYVFSSN